MGRTKIVGFTLLLLLASMAFACKPTVYPQVQASSWLSQLIHELEQGKPANPPAKIYRYTYNGREIYYLTGRCCDVPAKVYTSEGAILCEPDGGITGRGDGRCTDFFEKRSDETLIWTDKREQE